MREASAVREPVSAGATGPGRDAPEAASYLVITARPAIRP